MTLEKINNYFMRNPQLRVLFIFDKMNIIFTGVDECQKYHDCLQVVTEQVISIDLDNGEAVNYA